MPVTQSRLWHVRVPPQALDRVTLSVCVSVSATTNSGRGEHIRNSKHSRGSRGGSESSEDSGYSESASEGTEDGTEGVVGTVHLASAEVEVEVDTIGTLSCEQTDLSAHGCKGTGERTPLVDALDRGVHVHTDKPEKGAPLVTRRERPSVSLPSLLGLFRRKDPVAERERERERERREGGLGSHTPASPPPLATIPVAFPPLAVSLCPHDAQDRFLFSAKAHPSGRVSVYTAATPTLTQGLCEFTLPVPELGLVCVTLEIHSPPVPQSLPAPTVCRANPLRSLLSGSPAPFVHTVQSGTCSVVLTSLTMSTGACGGGGVVLECSVQGGSDAEGEGERDPLFSSCTHLGHRQGALTLPLPPFSLSLPAEGAAATGKPFQTPTLFIRALSTPGTGTAPSLIGHGSLPLPPTPGHHTLSLPLRHPVPDIKTQRQVAFAGGLDAAYPDAPLAEDFMHRIQYQLTKKAERGNTVGVIMPLANRIYVERHVRETGSSIGQLKQQQTYLKSYVDREVGKVNKNLNTVAGSITSSSDLYEALDDLKASIKTLDGRVEENRSSVGVSTHTIASFNDLDQPLARQTASLITIQANVVANNDRVTALRSELQAFTASGEKGLSDLEDQTQTLIRECDQFVAETPILIRDQQTEAQLFTKGLIEAEEVKLREEKKLLSERLTTLHTELVTIRGNVYHIRKAVDESIAQIDLELRTAIREANDGMHSQVDRAMQRFDVLRGEVMAAIEEQRSSLDLLRRFHSEVKSLDTKWRAAVAEIETRTDADLAELDRMLSALIRDSEKRHS
ncbi:B9 domain containing protein, partial [Kipferlia bialata]|eukprot:g4909.t1